MGFTRRIFISLKVHLQQSACCAKAHRRAPDCAGAAVATAYAAVVSDEDVELAAEPAIEPAIAAAKYTAKHAADAAKPANAADAANAAADAVSTKHVGCSGVLVRGEAGSSCH